MTTQVPTNQTKSYSSWFVHVLLTIFQKTKLIQIYQGGGTVDDHPPSNSHSFYCFWSIKNVTHHSTIELTINQKMTFD